LGTIYNLPTRPKTILPERVLIKQYGARPLKRAIQKYIEDALAEEIVNSKLEEGDTIHMDLE